MNPAPFARRHFPGTTPLGATLAALVGGKSAQAAAGSPNTTDTFAQIEGGKAADIALLANDLRRTASAFVLSADATPDIVRELGDLTRR